MEIWKDIKGYEGLYQVSNLGNVRSLERKCKKKTKSGSFSEYKVNEKIISQNVCGGGYLKVHLYNDTKRKAISVHKLVADAFIPNPNEYGEVNHKDEDKTNNKVENLEWCDRKYNQNYGTCIERMAKGHINNEKSMKPIAQYSLSGDLIATYPSVAEAGRRLGVCKRSLSQVANNGKGTAYGYKWEYV